MSLSTGNGRGRGSIGASVGEPEGVPEVEEGAVPLLGVEVEVESEGS